MARRVRPAVAIELLSPGIQDEDLGRKSPGKQPGKWKVEQILGVPYYITFNRYNSGKPLASRQSYQAMDCEEGSGCLIWK